MMNRRRFVQLLGATALVSVAPIETKAYRRVPLPDNQPAKKWLLCDGRYLDRKDYPELYDLLGDKFGGYTEYFIKHSGIPPDFVKETFRLPDYAAKFLTKGGEWKCPYKHNHMIKALPDGKDWPAVGTVVQYAGSEDRINSLL